MKTLSIVIPAYNEERFIGDAARANQGCRSAAARDSTKEIIVVDDCSRDRTRGDSRGCAGRAAAPAAKNGGKGRAVRAGIGLATGDYLIIQDADLEYDPRDYVPMMRAMLDGRQVGRRVWQPISRPADAIAQSIAGGVSRRPQPEPGHRSAVHRPLPDRHRHRAEAVRRRDMLPRCRSRRPGSSSITRSPRKVLARGMRIDEVPIRYYPRTRAEGKKIGMRDWFIATKTLWKYRRG